MTPEHIMPLLIKVRAFMYGYKSKEYREITNSNWAGYTVRPIDDEYVDIVSQYPFSTFPLINTNPSAFSKKKVVCAVEITNPLRFIKGDNKFVDYFKEYKTHCVVDLVNWSPYHMCKNHRKNVNRFYNKGKTVKINPRFKWSKFYADTYNELIGRHNIKDNSNFTSDQLKAMMEVPGAVLLETEDSWSLFYMGEGEVYYHLSCSTSEGYKNCSPYGLMFEAINFFKGLGCRKMLLGSYPDGTDGSGLMYFKEGWGTYTTPNYIIGQVLDKEKFEELSSGLDKDFFPPYRKVK